MPDPFGFDSLISSSVRRTKEAIGLADTAVAKAQEMRQEALDFKDLAQKAIDLAGFWMERAQILEGALMELKQAGIAPAFGLFQDQHQVDSLHDCVLDATGTSHSKEDLFKLFLSLPPDIRQTAYLHGLGDTPSGTKSTHT